MGLVPSNHTAPEKQSNLGWKEGHILKGLKHLQKCSSREASALAFVHQCKDCMTTNESIYSISVKCGQGTTSVPGATTNTLSVKSEAGSAAVDSQLNGVSIDNPTREVLCLNFTKDDEPAEPTGNSCLFPSPITDQILVVKSPPVKLGVSPTDSLSRLEEINNETLEKHKLMMLSDRNNNQERSSDRKSRLDRMKTHQGILTTRQTGTSEVNVSPQHSLPRALTYASEARQRSSSVEVLHCRDRQRPEPILSKSPQRTQKPQPCDSARKAFILRSKSEDGGPEQSKHVHSPLHQKFMKGQRSKGHPNPAGLSFSNKRSNHCKLQSSSNGTLSNVDKDEDTTSSKSLKLVQPCSPLASPVKHCMVAKPPGVSECSKSPKKSSMQATRIQPRNDAVGERVYDNLPCSPQKQPKEQHCDSSVSEVWSSDPPAPPGRTTSLNLGSSCLSQPSLPKSVGLQSPVTGKKSASMAKPQSNDFSHIHLSKTTKDSQPTASQMDSEGSKPMKDVLTKVHSSHSSRIPSIPVQESAELSMVRTVTCNVGPTMMPSQNILQRSQQSISEPKLLEVLPPTYSNVFYHSVANNPSSSSSRPGKLARPINAKSHEAITGQDNGTFLIFGRQSKDDTKSIKGVQTFQPFSLDPQMAHDTSGNDKVPRMIETRCNSLDSEPCGKPVPSDSHVMLDWGFDEEGWLFKRSVSVSTRPLLKPVLGMNGAKARSQSFGARYMDRPSFNRSGKIRTQIKTHSGSSLNSLGDVLPGSMSCSNSYHCPMNRSLLNNFLIEEGLAVPPPLGTSSERLQSLKHQREQARRLQIEQQFSSAFGEPVSEEPESQSTITTIEEKVMLGIEENLHKCQEQVKSSEVKQKPSSTLANWFGFRKSKLPAPTSKKADPPKVKEDKREQKITSLLSTKQQKSDKKRDRRKSDGKDW